MDFGAAIAAGINQATTVGMGLINNNQARKAQARALRYDKELSKYNYDLEVEQWNRANAYNTPSAQMQRYRAAGLNPNLIYTQSNEAANSAPTAGASFAGGSGYEPLPAMNFVDSYTALAQQQLNERNNEADVNLKNSQANKNAADTATTLLNNIKLSYERPYWSQNAKYDSDFKKHQAAIAKQDAFGKLYDNLVMKPEQFKNLQLTNDQIGIQTNRIREEILSIRQDRMLSKQERTRRIKLLDKELAWYDRLQAANNANIRANTLGQVLSNSYNTKSMHDRLRLTRYQADLAGIDRDWNIADKTLQRFSQGMTELGRTAIGGALWRYVGPTTNKPFYRNNDSRASKKY